MRCLHCFLYKNQQLMKATSSIPVVILLILALPSIAYSYDLTTDGAGHIYLVVCRIVRELSTGMIFGAVAALAIIWRGLTIYTSGGGATFSGKVDKALIVQLTVGVGLIVGAEIIVSNLTTNESGGECQAVLHEYSETHTENAAQLNSTPSELYLTALDASNTSNSYNFNSESDSSAASVASFNAQNVEASRAVDASTVALNATMGMAEGSAAVNFANQSRDASDESERQAAIAEQESQRANDAYAAVNDAFNEIQAALSHVSTFSDAAAEAVRTAEAFASNPYSDTFEQEAIEAYQHALSLEGVAIENDTNFAELLENARIASENAGIARMAAEEAEQAAREAADLAEEMRDRALSAIDMTTWEVNGNDSNWVVAEDGNSVRQTVNGQPTFFVSQGDFINVRITGEIRVDTTNDDDHIGFVVGYQPPTADNNNAQDFLLFSWKQGTQTWSGNRADEGMYLLDVDSSLGPIDLWEHQRTVTGADGQISQNVLATGGGNNDGWNDNQTYAFEIVYRDNNISISIDGVERINVDGSFDAGRFGYYNFSQGNVVYSNVFRENLE